LLLRNHLAVAKCASNLAMIAARLPLAAVLEERIGGRRLPDTLAELIASVTPPSSPAAVAEPPEPTVWERLAPEWPPFEPPAELPSNPSIEWLWLTLFSEAPPVAPTAIELAQRAAAEDARYPEAHPARYRRSHPHWLAETLALHVKLSRAQRWQRIEMLLTARATPEAGWNAADRRRIAWLQDHAAAIRAVIEEAKAPTRSWAGSGT